MTFHMFYIYPLYLLLILTSVFRGFDVSSVHRDGAEFAFRTNDVLSWWEGESMRSCASRGGDQRCDLLREVRVTSTEEATRSLTLEPRAVTNPQKCHMKALRKDE